MYHFLIICSLEEVSNLKFIEQYGIVSFVTDKNEILNYDIRDYVLVIIDKVYYERNLFSFRQIESSNIPVIFFSKSQINNYHGDYHIVTEIQYKSRDYFKKSMERIIKKILSDLDFFESGFLSFQNYPHKIVITERNGRIVYVNQRLIDFFKYSKTELIKRRFHAKHMFAFSEKVFTDIENELTSNHSIDDKKVEIIDAEGNIYSAIIAAWQFSKNKKLYSVITFRVINEAKIQQSQLEIGFNSPKSRDKTKELLIENSSDIYLLVDSAYKILHYNHRWKTLFQYGKKESINQKITKIFGESEAIRFFQSLASCFSEKKNKYASNVFLKSKDEIKMLTNVAFYYIQENDKEYCQVVIKSIDQIYKLELELKSYQKILSMIEIPFIIINDKYEFMMLNRFAKKLFGFTGVDENLLWQEVVKNNPFLFNEIESYLNTKVIIKVLNREYIGKILKIDVAGLIRYVIRLWENDNYGEMNKISFSSDLQYSLYQTIDDIIISMDSNMLIQHLNPSGKLFFDRASKEEDIFFINYSSPLDKYKIISYLNAVLIGEEHVFEARLKNKQGSERWFSISALPIYNGEIIHGILALARDIQKQKEIEEELKFMNSKLENEIRQQTKELAYSEKQYRSLINGAMDLIFMVNVNYEFTMMNDAALLLVGTNLTSVIGKKPNDVLPRDLAYKITKGIKSVFSTGKPSTDDTSVKFFGEMLYFQTNLSPVRDETGVIIEIVGIARDVSSKVKLEEDLKKQEQHSIQSSKMAALGEIATGIAHELNQPLNHLRLTLTMNQMELERDAPDLNKISKMMSDSVKDMERAEKIIKHLRNFGRSEPVNDLIPVDVHKVIEESKMLFAQNLQDNNIQLILSLDANYSVTMGGFNRLEQVVLNLISNAKDAVIKTAKPKIVIRTYNEGDFLLLEVEDNGEGIKKEYFDQIFTPFFTTKELGKGTGIGLSITYGIIKSFNGEIAAKNVGENGAILQVKLPRLKEKAIEHSMR
jgi:PAS domain S-box-containing protein